MAILTVVITHLDAAAVGRQLDYLRRLAPDSRFAVCHGGSRAEFDRLTGTEAAFVADPSLRGPVNQQSYLEVLRTANERFVAGDESIEHVHVMEYDHLVLRGDFERALAELAQRTGAGLVAKAAQPRNDTNWSHFLRYRRDEAVNAFFARISRRDDHTIRWGSLGTGLLLRRDALEALCGVRDVPHAYLEMMIPTLVHHLGFDVVDADAVGDLYAALRWRPEYSLQEALAVQQAGGTFVHPFKRLDGLEALA